MGCTINRDFIKCRECPTETGGFYDSKSGVSETQYKMNITESYKDNNM